MSSTNQTWHIEWFETFKCKCRIMKNVGIMKNVDVNAKNKLTKECVMKDLFKILVIVNVDEYKLCNVREYLEYENCKSRKK